MRWTSRSEEYERWGELNTRLHVSIAGYTGMPTLREMTERVFDLWYRVRRCFFSEVVLQRVLQSQQRAPRHIRSLARA